MKEATGDLSMTAVAIVAIAAIAAVFTMLIWPQIRNTINVNTICAQAFGCETDSCNARGDRMQCHYVVADDPTGQQTDTIMCPCDSEAVQ